MSKTAKTLKILLVHTSYLQSAGEDKVVNEELSLLSKRHEVSQFIRSNEEMLKLPSWKQALKTIWNREAAKSLKKLLYEFQPDIIHVHNTFPLLSPAVFFSMLRWKKHCEKRLNKKTAVVYTLHNFRLICPQASLTRNGKLCQQCIDSGSFAPALQNKCFRQNRKMTWVLVSMLRLHHHLKTWHKAVDAFLYLNESQKKLYIRQGFPSEKFYHKPNFVFDPFRKLPANLHFIEYKELKDTCHFVFIGRLTSEKGLRLIMAAKRRLKEYGFLNREVAITIIGEGDLQNSLREEAGELKITVMDYQAPAVIERILKSQHFLLFPSIWYEGMPMIMLEAMSQGLPPIAYDLGFSSEIIEHQKNGLLLPFFRSEAAARKLDLQQVYSEDELAEKLAETIKEACGISSERYHFLSIAARKTYEEHFTPQNNIKFIENIYNKLLS